MPVTMTHRQRLLAALAGQPTDVMPWFADLTYWRHARQLDGTLSTEYEGEEGLVRLHADLGVGYYLGYATAHVEVLDDVRVSAATEGNVTLTRWATPVGDIVAETTFLPRSASGAVTQWPVTRPADLRVLRYIAEATHYKPAYEDYERHNELAGDQGHPTVLPPRSPLSQMLAQWAGVEGLTFLLADARAAVEAVLAALARAADSAYDAICRCATPYVELGDNLTGEVVTHLFERYQFDYYVQRAEQLHAAGKLMGTHLDGTMRGILPVLARTGLDFVESITPAPCGDVRVDRVRELAGADLVLFGGIPGAMFAAPFGPDDVRRQVELVVRHHWPNGKWILGSADQVPPHGDISLVRLIGEWVRQLC